MSIFTQIRSSIEFSSSGCNDLRVAYINDADDGSCAVSVFGSCMHCFLYAASSPYQLVILTVFLRDMSKVYKRLYSLLCLVDFRQGASEVISAPHTVQCFNDVSQEERNFTTTYLIFLLLLEGRRLLAISFMESQVGVAMLRC